MNDAQLISALKQPQAYPGHVRRVEHVETHMSWVFLTGSHAYKVKKPVRFDFVDFSTIERRHHFCEEEIRCNRRFAPELYLGVVPIVIADDGSIKVSGPGRVIEWAVCMTQFEPGTETDRLLDQGELEVSELNEFGKSLALLHERLEPIVTSVDQTRCVLDNFDVLRGLPTGNHHQAWLERLERAAKAEIDKHQPFFASRHADGRIRECHGDLHLANIVRTDAGLMAFDCLEFEVGLRTIDVFSDAAFLFMDCASRGARNLAYAFLDGYLDTSGDYAGVALLPFWARYRSMVRAKVAALRLAQPQLDPESRRINEAKAEQHLRWALDQYARRPVLILTCGLSGSGKSYWAEQLVSAIGAIRLRSDVYRKSRHGLAPKATTSSKIGEGLYTADQSLAVYRGLARFARQLLQEGETVIVDAAHLTADQRQILYDTASDCQTPAVVMYFQAPDEVLRDRIERRQRDASDASEADQAVLTWQQTTIDPPGADEPACLVDTERTSIEQLVSLLINHSAGRLSDGTALLNAPNEIN